MFCKIKIITIFNLLLLMVSIQAQNTIPFQEVSGNSKDSLLLAGAVNELHIVPDSGRSGNTITLSFTINNTDQFSAFQFDIILPSVMTYVQDSVWLFRTTDHFIITNLVNQQTLRVVAFSPSNSVFTGNDGEIVRVMFNLNGTAGTYNVGLSNVTISNPVGVNILTAYYPGYIKITSPDIFGGNNLDFGEISVLDTLTYDYELSNTGNDTLFVTDFFSSETYFWVDTSLPQNIPPYESKIFNLKFHNINKGQYSATYTIRSNDPDEDPFYVEVIATSFAPNYILIEDAQAFVRDTVTLKIDVNNYEQFIDFQVDLDFPDSLTYVPNSATLTNRKQDQILFDALLNPNKIRLFTFSSGQLPFLGDTGTVATMKFVVGNDTGTFPLNLSGGILTDASLQNIIRATIDGEIFIQKRPTFQLSVSVDDRWNMVSVPGFNTNGQGVDIWWSGNDPTTDVYKYSGGGYQVVSFAIPGEGYWMKNVGAQTYNTGDEWPADGIEFVTHNPINAVEGWNIIGGYEDTVQTNNLTSSPPGLITGFVYGYSGGYNPITELFPGYAYWIKLTGPGQIIFPTIFSKQQGHFVKFFKENWGKITLTDANGRSFTLYAVNDEVSLDQYEMPPMPPSGMFDIRFSSGRIAEVINNSMKSIEMSGIEYPVRVKVENMNVLLQDETGHLINEKLLPGEEFFINNISVKKLLVMSSDLLTPTEYGLEQNYPNPFNPSTTIKFSLPEAADVKLNIYNTLGEKVAELLNTNLEAGYHSLVWDAPNNASGIYIYELRAPNFVAMKKMVLLK